MKNLRWIARLAAAVALAGGWAAQASPITLIHTGSGSGTLNGVAFANAAFTITALGDTDDRQACGAACFEIVHSSATIDIQGVGLLSFVTGTSTFAQDASNIVGFSRAIGPDLFDGPSSALLDGYDLSSSIGPIAGFGNVFQWEEAFGGSVLTSGGVLYFNQGVAAASFEAIVQNVPEPGTLALAGTLLLGLATLRRRRT